MEELRTQARFPEVATGKGHYESFYLRAFDPQSPRAVWIRYTVHKRPGDRPNGSLWFTLFDAAADGPSAAKATLSGPRAGQGKYIQIGESSFEPGHVKGSTGTAVSWDLRFEASEPAFRHLPRSWMYRAPIPKTKLLSPYPDARFDGTVDAFGEQIDVSGWPGMVGHNWGSQHAERWIWMHGAGFEGGAWLDVAIGRVRLGPVTLPWIANGVLALDGERHRLGSVKQLAETPTGCEFELGGKDVTVRGSVGAEKKDFVGWVYADPDGPEHNTVNCSVAHMHLRVERDGRPPLELDTPRGAAYELGMRERDHGIPIQPFPDG